MKLVKALGARACNQYKKVPGEQDFETGSMFERDT